MTREEAKEIIEDLKYSLDISLIGTLEINEIDNAMVIAIKALEQQPCEDWYDVPSYEMTLEQARQAVKDLRKKLAEYLEQEPCDMKQRVEKEYLYESLCEDLKKANAEIKRLSEPFEDAISRQAVDELSKELVHTTRDKADFLCNFWEGLQKLPSVTPKSKSEYEHDHEVVKAYNDGQAYILDKIRAEIEQGYCKVENDYDKGRNMGLHIAMQIIDKYRGE